MSVEMVGIGSAEEAPRYSDVVEITMTKSGSWRAKFVSGRIFVSNPDLEIRSKGMSNAFTDFLKDVVNFCDMHRLETVYYFKSMDRRRVMTKRRTVHIR